MPRDVKREAYFNWLVTAFMGLLWVAGLIWGSLDPLVLISFGVLVLVMALLSWRHTRQVSRGQPPPGMPKDFPGCWGTATLH
jgi:hypothetical protein